MSEFRDVGFSDIERREAIAICETLISANRIDRIIPALRQGATLDDVRQQLAGESVTAVKAAPQVQKPAASPADRLEVATQQRLAEMSKPLPPWT